MSSQRSLAVCLIVFFSLLLFAREAYVSGSAVGTVTEAYFELSGDDGRRIHFADSGDESDYHRKERDKIAASLGSLADKIEVLIEKLRKKEPWSRLIRPYRPGMGAEPGVSLAHFEQAEYGPWLGKIQQEGPYLYTTSFGHRPEDGRHLAVTVRFVFEGHVAPVSLYELEDGLHRLKTPFAEDARYVANPDGVKLQTTGCDEHQENLERIRAGFTRRLREKGLFYQGHEFDGTLFVAGLEGRDMCLASFELLLAGRHHRGRAKQAFVQAVQDIFKRAVEWPGFPPDPHADLAPWRIVVEALP